MKKPKILVFSGAGISKESGIETFRGSSGSLWNNFDVNKVANINAWKNNKQEVIDFYNLRRNEADKCLPNSAHLIIAELEDHFDIHIATQNVDLLHEKAGSTDIIHLHGELNKLRSENDRNLISEWKEDLKIGDLAEDGHQLRPHIIFFGEDLCSDDIANVKEAAKDVDVCIIIGTSMQVQPANGIPFLTPETALIYYVDPGDVDFYIPTFRKYFFTHIQEDATKGMEILKKELFDIFKIKEQ